MKSLKIEYIETEKLIPYINNPRINENAVDVVAGSIKEFGFKNPIIVDNDNVIVAGHTRLKAARKLGLEEVPIIKVEDLTEAQIKAFRIADNKTSEFAEWDMELLEIELEGLDNEFTGFDIDELGELFNDDTEVTEDDFDEEPPEDPISKRGDIWLLGKHRLMCGDSTSEEDVNKLMNGVKADMVFTDPPYGNGESGKYGRGQLGVRTILNDENLNCFNEFIKIMPCDKIVYFLQWRTLAESMQTIIKKGLKINTVGVWDKKNAGLNGAGGISEQWEAIIFAGDIKYKKFGGNVFNVAREQHKRSESLHPHIKPQQLLKEIFDYLDNVNVVLDAFGGSGSTLIACEQLNRICCMMELDPKYVDVIVNRYISFKESDEDVFLIRDGTQIHYKEVEKNE